MKNSKILKTILFLFIALLGLPLSAHCWEFRGNASMQGVSYLKDRGQERRDEQAIFHLDLRMKEEIRENLSVTLRPEVYYEITEPRIKRWEPLEGYMDYQADSWDLRLGQAVESWAITDTFNPVDVLNRRDLERGLMRAPKMGEVMARFRYFFPAGENIYNQSLNMYLLPWFRESRFPKKDDPYSFERTGARVEDRDGIKPGGFHQMGLALRYGATWESLDFFLLAYHGVTRNPIFQAESGPDALLLRPVYYPVDKAGGGFQWARGDWLWKLEFVRTWTHRRHLGSRLLSSTVIPAPFTQYVLGFDRPFYDIGLQNSTLTWTLEYSGEDRTGNAPGEYRPFKSDVFTRFRYEFGNISQMALSVNFAYDIRIGENITDAAFEWKPSRAFENLKLILEGEYQRAARGEVDSFLSFFPENSYVAFKTEWSF